jgi:hypothetical protein
MSARISNHAQELAKQALNQVIQQKGLDKDMIWELVSKLKRFLNNLIQMASKKGATVKQAVESNVSKLMVRHIQSWTIDILTWQYASLEYSWLKIVQCVIYVCTYIRMSCMHMSELEEPQGQVGQWPYYFSYQTSMHSQLKLCLTGIMNGRIL